MLAICRRNSLTFDLNASEDMKRRTAALQSLACQLSVPHRRPAAWAGHPAASRWLFCYQAARHPRPAAAICPEPSVHREAMV